MSKIQRIFWLVSSALMPRLAMHGWRPRLDSYSPLILASGLGRRMLTWGVENRTAAAAGISG